MEKTSFLEDMEKIQRAMCHIKGNFMSLVFDRNHFLEPNEFLHDAYLNNNEDNHKLTIQNEQLLEKLQDTCFSSYVSDCQMVDCLENSHDMVDHEKCVNLKVIYVFEDELEEIQTLYVVKMNLKCLLMKVMQFLKKSTIPLHWDQSMTKVSHF